MPQGVSGPQKNKNKRAPPLTPGAVTEFEYFPDAPSAAACEPGHIALARAADGGISRVDGILPHVPTVAKAFRERLRACPDPASWWFQTELKQLWRVLFRPHDVSRRSALVMTQGAAFEFAINELLLACEERRYMEPEPTPESQALAPLHFLKQDACFLDFVSSQLGLMPSVSSVRSGVGHFVHPCAVLYSN